MSLCTCTPLRLKYGQKLATTLEVHVLFRALLLRLALLVVCHGGETTLALLTGETVSALVVVQYRFPS